jgi:hypothetical protein
VGNPRLGRKTNTGAAIAALLALAAIAAGCGGSGSDSSSEAAARKKLEAGAQKLTDAKSFRVSVPIEAEVEGQTEELGCVDLALEHHGKNERFDLLFFDQSCSGGLEAHELIAVNHQAWASSSDDPESWTAATITPAVLDELDDEQTDLKGLFKAAEDIEVDDEAGAVDEGESDFVDVPVYSFEAPASAFPGSDDPDLGDVKIEFEAVLDKKGYLRKLTVHGEEDGTGATVSDEYEDIGENLEIAPPDPSEVKGPKQQIRSKADLDRLFGVPST